MSRSQYDYTKVYELAGTSLRSAEIAAQTGIPNFAVVRALRRFGKARPAGRPVRYVTDITALYESGLSTADIETQTGIPASAVKRQLRKRGVIRSRGDGLVLAHARRGRGVPDSFTFQTLTRDTAWLLGVIYGDGSLDKRHRSVLIASADSDVTENIIRIAGIRHRLFVNGNCTNVTINSRRICKELHDVWGLVPHKGPVMTFPHMSAELMPHFVRGLLDSDGCWSIRRDRSSPRLRFSYGSTSADFVVGLRDVLRGHVHVSATPNVRSSGVRQKATHHTLWTLRYSHHDSVALGEWLYQGSAATNRCARKFTVWNTLRILPARKRPISCVCSLALLGIPGSLQTSL